ncbi:unnamed protein product [Adineta ricciae]|uniref:AIG1-type G domain-containing protein n=1 Tax=Adineta ricciae TaxID=249248 RepID=A0A816DWE1_ADIRI|nr:unnamed protein product [Adineta ricciae]CAF1642786.1 unnamed protein product [Adineta ricciae]
MPGKFFNSHAPFNIVLIGQTGSGKTSLLNLLLNINQIADFKINSKTLNESLRLYNNVSLEMGSNGTSMNSKTSDCQDYSTKFEKYTLRILDTPGLADTRGFTHDQNHTKSIIRAIERLEYVHCIILVINGRESRETEGLKYVLEEIFAIMPREIQSNIVVVFTNVNNVLKLNFNISTLTKYVQKEIQHYWLIDNPICELEKAQGKLRDDRRLVADEKTIATLTNSFQRTVSTIRDMYNTTSHFPSIGSNAFHKLYKLKEQIEQQYLNLTSEHEDLMRQTQRIQEIQENIKLFQKKKITSMNFNKTELTEKTVLEPTDEHNTLCAHAGCHHNCHLNCYLPLTLEPGAEIFKGCAAMDSTGLTCTKCGHSYKDHYHVKSKWVTKQERRYYIDADTEKEFNSAKTDEERAMVALKSLQQQLNRLETNILELQNRLLELLKEYKKVGLRRNYLALIKAQDSYVQMSIKTFRGDPKEKVHQNLLSWKTKLELMIELSRGKDHTDL